MFLRFSYFWVELIITSYTLQSLHCYKIFSIYYLLLSVTLHFIILLSDSLRISTHFMPKTYYNLSSTLSSKLIISLSGIVYMLKLFEKLRPIFIYSTYLTIFAAIESISRSLIKPYLIITTIMSRNLSLLTLNSVSNCLSEISIRYLIN